MNSIVSSLSISSFKSSCVVFFLISMLIINCHVEPQVKSSINERIEQDPYWYQGKAEISSYELIQNRYNDLHPGEVIMIFVSEDFLTDKQVKNDNYKSKNTTSILKNNKVKRFSTGVYDYSVMTSVFTPFDRSKYPHSIKVTNGSQDWCGQTFQQLNLREDKYESTIFSYFENEGDIESETTASYLEDEIPGLIRINPESLPIGDFTVIPSLEFLRLRHKPLKNYNATGKLTKGDKKFLYTLHIPELDKTIKWDFEKEKPFKINGWEVSYPSAFDGKIRTTKAIKKAESYAPYWSQNSVNDLKFREELKLMY